MQQEQVRRWIVKSLLAMLVIVPVALVAVYLINPWQVRSLDPRQRITSFGPYRVPSSSMEPTVHPGQVLIARAGRPGTQSLQRGDMVTLLVPGREGEIWLQRIVGLPGETLSIVDGRVHVDGRPLDEPYVDPDRARADYSRSMPAERIPPGHYFMMGDNRDNSLDSRMQGLTRREDITGRVVALLP